MIQTTIWKKRKKMKSEPYVLVEENLSHAWARVMLHLLSKGVSEVSPLVVNIHLTNNQPVEAEAVRALADIELAKFGKPLCETTAGTIFPKSLWTPAAGPEALFTRYDRILPRLRKCPLNHYGIYFERLIKHGGSVNQLDHILKTWKKGNHRRSALQALIFDPSRDHTDQRMRGFPCLQQVMFVPEPDGLVVSGVYGVQYIFDRAYGNYLGLCRLGQFMAHEMGLPLIRLQCVTTIAELGTPNKAQLQPLAAALNDLVPDAEYEASSVRSNSGRNLTPSLFDHQENYANSR
jgi:hypothetical protein